MFNWSLELRKQTEFISPEGPNFDSAPWKDLYLSGTHIKIKVPHHRTTAPTESVDTIHPCDLNQLNDKLYEENGIRLHFFALIHREWEFYGPWFTGRLGGITMPASIVSPVDIPEGLNYFHPRALEAGIADMLTHSHGSDFSADGTKQTWFAPMNWQPRIDLPCVGVRFDAVNTRVKRNGNGPGCFLIMPIDKHHFLMVYCSISRATVFTDKIPEPTVDEWINHAPFLKLANQVLDSVQVTLSPQAQADQEEALRGLDDKSLVKEYPPIKWTKQPEVDSFLNSHVLQLKINAGKYYAF